MLDKDKTTKTTLISIEDIEVGDTILTPIQIGKVIKIHTAYGMTSFTVELPSGEITDTNWYKAPAHLWKKCEVEP